MPKKESEKLMTEVPKASEGYEYEVCKFTVEKPIATFMISNPRARNSYTMKTWEGLSNAIQVVRDDDDIRVLVITGDPEGKTFCAGLNVKSVYKGRAAEAGQKVEVSGAPPPLAEENFFPGTAWNKVIKEKGAIFGADMGMPADVKSKAHAKYVWWKAHTLRGGYWMTRAYDLLRLPKPVIAMVNGMGAWGAGADLAFHCDIICMSDQANLTWNYIHRTVLPAEGAAFWLSRIIGYQRALEIIWRAKPVSAQQAYDWGLINHVWSEAELKEKTYSLAMELATEIPPMNLGLNKYHVQLALDDFVHKAELFQDTVTRSMAAIVRDSEDMLEAVRAFAEKRKPVYHGK
jgi:enoyl-CoA hydratase/carnithine racemase